jgi:putative transposase
MAQMCLRAKRKKRHYHSYKGEVGKIAPNVIARDFDVDKPNKKWTTDVTQINIGDSKMYLSPILDMYNGEIISYSISRSPNLRMVTEMLKSAFRKNNELKGVILHSDQGWHYQHSKYQKMLKDKEIIQSMSRKGNCLDNAMMENFFGLMKNELLYVNNFDSIEVFEKELRKYIWWYNNKRIYCCPVKLFGSIKNWAELLTRNSAFFSSFAFTTKSNERGQKYTFYRTAGL